MLRAGQERPVPPGAILLLSANARRGEAGAVVAIPERDRLEAPGGDPREPERDLHRVVAGRREQDLAEGRRRPVREPPRQADRHFVGEAARREREVVELGLEGRDQRRVGVPQMVNAVAVEVHEPAAVELFDPDPLGAPDGGQAGRRRGLVEKVARVLVDQPTRIARRVRLSRIHSAGIVSRRRTASRADGGAAGPETAPLRDRRGAAQPGPPEHACVSTVLASEPPRRRPRAGVRDSGRRRCLRGRPGSAGRARRSESRPTPTAP